MSEFQVRVVRIGEIHKHPNADVLSIVEVDGVGGYPVVIRTGEFKDGDLAVYVPVTALLPADDSRWAFLKPGPNGFEVEAKRLRGIFSMGLLTAAEPGWTLGQDVADLLRIKRAEPTEPTLGNEFDPGILPVYTDLANLRGNPDVLVNDEHVIITEKLHGESARFAIANGRLCCGSRTNWKHPDGGPVGGVPGAPIVEHAWWQIARRLGMKERLERVPGVGIYGEIFGNEPDMKYGATAEARGLRLFDAMWTSSRSYLSHADFEAVADKLGLPTVPILYRGPWTPYVRKLAEGESTLAKHVREGIVIRPAEERRDERIGRVILKFHGEGFLTRKRKV